MRAFWQPDISAGFPEPPFSCPSCALPLARRYELLNTGTGKIELKHLTSENAKNESASHFKDKETGGGGIWGGGAQVLQGESEGLGVFSNEHLSRLREASRMD
jgi:hypothetical protein